MNYYRYALLTLHDIHDTTFSVEVMDAAQIYHRMIEDLDLLETHMVAPNVHPKAVVLQAVDDDTMSDLLVIFQPARAERDNLMPLFMVRKQLPMMPGTAIEGMKFYLSARIPICILPSEWGYEAHQKAVDAMQFMINNAHRWHPDATEEELEEAFDDMAVVWNELNDAFAILNEKVREKIGA